MMPDDNNTIDDQALDGISVAPPADEDGAEQTTPATDPRQQAGQDESIARRLQRDPDNQDAQLDAGLDESMDASDPPANTQPGGEREPAASSGYDADAERQRGA